VSVRFIVIDGISVISTASTLGEPHLHTCGVGATVKIGVNVTVAVLGVRWENQPRIGFEAPRDVPVHREENFERSKRKHQASTYQNPGDGGN
jgi:carbon storage regulator